MSKEIAKILVDIKSINFSFDKYFTLTSGLASPVYVDCRKIISFTKERNFIIDKAIDYLTKNNIEAEIIAGGETAGIPYAAFISQKLEKQMNTLFSSAFSLYNQMLDSGVAKECARMVLPLCTPTRIYMTGSCRSWIHYINLRSAHGTQKEHMDIANACRKVFIEQFPTVSESLEWS